MPKVEFSELDNSMVMKVSNKHYVLIAHFESNEMVSSMKLQPHSAGGGNVPVRL